MASSVENRIALARPFFNTETLTGVMPSIAVAVLLIVWYVALVFSNPNRICEIYNAAHGIADAVAATPYQLMV